MNLVERKRTRIAREDRVGLLELFESWKDKDEGIDHDFQSYVREGYKDNGVVFGCILARALLFSEIRFKFRRLDSNDLFGNPDLELLERPWPNGTTGELLFRMEQDASLAGNAYVHKVPGENRLQRLRPDWIDIATDGRTVVGYVYHTGGRNRDRKTFIPSDEIAHWSPIPDPEAAFRGMSWLTPVAREVDADTLMTRHKGKFFHNAATPNMLIKVEKVLPDPVRERLRLEIERRYESWSNAYKTMFLEGGADATVVGNSFEQMSFTTVQAAGENRIAVASGVPGIVVGLKEGLQAATYSNYAQAKRRWVDVSMRPHWRSACSALAPLVNVPTGSELWYDEGYVAALREDEKDRSEIENNKARSMDTLIRAGFVPETVIQAVNTGDFRLLQHTGAIPTTLYPEGQEPQPA